MKKILSLAVFVTLFSTAQGMQPYFFNRNVAEQNFQRARQARVQPAAPVIEEPEELANADNWRDSDIYDICDDVAGDDVSEQDVVYMFNNNVYGDLHDAEVAWATYFIQNLGLNENVEEYGNEVNSLWYLLTNANDKSGNKIDELNLMLGNFSMGVQDVLAVRNVTKGEQLNQDIQQVPSLEEVMINLCQVVKVEYKKITRMHSDQLAALIYELVGDEE